MRTLAHISDLHFGRHDPSVAAALLAAIAERRPDLVVISGDLTQRARSAEFAEARQFVERIAQPKVIIPGNHDIPLYNVLRRMLTPTRNYERHISPLGLPAAFFADEEVAVLGLSTVRRLTGKNGRVSHEQMAELRRVFAAAPAGAFKVLATHHPVGAPTGAMAVPLAGRSQLTLRACAEAGVHLLLSGHYHTALSGHGPLAEVALERLILIVHAGTAISTRVRGEEGNSFNLIQVEPERVTVTVMKWSPAQGFAARGAVTYSLEGGRWRPGG